MTGILLKSRLWTISFVTLASTGFLHAQVAPISNAAVTHTADRISIDAREPRPLRQAIAGLRSEYGWIVDYEDPVYDGASELIDDTSVQWQAQHPSEKGVTRPAGKEFKCNLAPPTAAQSSPYTSPFDMFSNLSSAYNSSGNPGQFAVVSEPDQRLAVVGRTSSLPSGLSSGLFGTDVTLPIEKRTALATVNQIFEQVSAAQGRRVVLGYASINVLGRTQVEVGGSSRTARELLADTLTQAGVRLVWEALYDADVDTYFVNILPAVHAYYGVAGERIEVLTQPK